MIEDKLTLICAYCGTEYKWIDHKHTQGFYEHDLSDCKFNSHKILRRIEKK